MVFKDGMRETGGIQGYEGRASTWRILHKQVYAGIQVYGKFKEQGMI